MRNRKSIAPPARQTEWTTTTATARSALAVALIGAGGAVAQPVNNTPINSNLPPGALPSSWDPTYNVCRGVDPKCYHNWVDDRQMKVLVYSRTGGPRHANIGTALGPGKNTQNATTIAVTCTADAARAARRPRQLPGSQQHRAAGAADLAERRRHRGRHHRGREPAAAAEPVQGRDLHEPDARHDVEARHAPILTDVQHATPT